MYRVFSLPSPLFAYFTSFVRCPFSEYYNHHCAITKSTLPWYPFYTPSVHINIDVLYLFVFVNDIWSFQYICNISPVWIIHRPPWSHITNLTVLTVRHSTTVCLYSINLRIYRYITYIQLSSTIPDQFPSFEPISCLYHTPTTVLSL